MATGFPVKGTGGSTSYANGNALSASDLNDGFGTLNFLAAFYTGNPALLGALETCNVVASAATGTINVDAKTSTVWYYTTNASANFTLNFRGNSTTTLASVLSVGQSITIVFLNTNGATPYYPTVYQIDGSAVTPKWQGGTAPSAGNASSIDAYSVTIIKTAATPTYTVIGSQTKFA
jgi:hypothetical protein